MNKKVIIAICLAIVIVAAAVCIYLFCIKGDKVNYTKMEEDKQSIMENGTVINAKEKDHDLGSAKIEYEGEGYIVEEWRGGEVTTFKIIVDGKEEWNYKKEYPFTTN